MIADRVTGAQPAKPDRQLLLPILGEFARMGYQYGIGCEDIHIGRWGYCYNPARDARDPTQFEYCMDAPPFVEPWGQGLVVYLNPRGLHPLPRDWFPCAAQCYLKDGVFLSDHLSWHPFASKTVIVHMGEVKRQLRERTPPWSSRLAVGAITQAEFRQGCSFPASPLGEELGWFSDETDSFLGVVIRDTTDADWGYVVLARDAFFRFRCIDVESSLPTRDEAREAFQFKMAEYVRAPQRIFPQE